MRLCVVSGTFHPEPGGPPTYLYHLLPELLRRGHALSVITYGKSNASPAESYPYPVNRISRRLPIPLRLAAMTRAVLAEASRADVLFVSDYGLPPALANLALGKPMVLKNVGDFAWEFSTRHGWIPPGQSIDDFQTAKHTVKVNLLRRVQAAYTQAATRVIAPSRYSAGLVQGWGVPPSRVRVVYNALDLAPFEALPSKAEARLTLGLPPEAPMGLCVARLAPWKGVDRLIRAWPEVQARAGGGRLLVVGDGPCRGEWEAMAAQAGLSEWVTFTGAQPPERTRLYMRAADAFVLYSRYEGLPHTVLEAQAAGTPVVVSEAGGNLEVVEHERTGLVVRLDDEAALARALAGVLTDRQLAERLANNARDALERFSWPRLVEQTEAVLLEAVETGRR